MSHCPQTALLKKTVGAKRKIILAMKGTGPLRYFSFTILKTKYAAIKSNRMEIIFIPITGGINLNRVIMPIKYR